MVLIFKSRRWIPSEVKDILKGDFFFKEDDGKRSAMFIAASDAYQKPHPHNPGKKIWSVDTEPVK